MAGASWTVEVSPTTIDEVTITAGTTTETVACGGIFPSKVGYGGWGFTTSAFPETTEVTLSATGYNDVTAIVGTTSSVTFTEAPTTPTVANLSDGTNTYEIEDSQARADIQEIQRNYVTKATLEAIYPVGSVYIGTQSTCPMSTVMSGTTWTLVSSGKALWTGNGTNGGTTINAGLPNITGNIENSGGGGGFTEGSGTGCFTDTTNYAKMKTHAASNSSYDTIANKLVFNASKSSSIYGKSTTVQPPAYVVNVWRRTA